jgi:hypothetical protein
MKRHLTEVTRQPAEAAQFEPLLELISVISASLGVLSTCLAIIGQANNLFGWNISQKGDKSQ